MKKYCSCCGRQFVNRDVNADDKFITSSHNAIADCCGKFICSDCGRDLDEYGLFPEERGDH